MRKHLKTVHQIKCSIKYCNFKFESHDEYSEHILKNHNKPFTFMYLDTPEMVNKWLTKKSENYDVEDTFKLLRGRFSERNSDNKLRNDILKNP